LRGAQHLRRRRSRKAVSAEGPRFAGESNVIDGVFNSDALPVLERLAQFAGGRHRLIVNNIANLDTPGYRPVDVSVSDFQNQMAEAVDQRRSGKTPGGTFTPADSTQIEFRSGSLELHPEPKGDNILFHDGNDRDLERTMQDLVENFLAFRTATELMRSRLDLINTAITERI
jgi:flagellar basal-body rod protein FlgB